MVQTELEKGLEGFAQGLVQGAGVSELHAAMAATVDACVVSLFNKTVVPKGHARVAVMALGGYGSRQMSPRSDIDLLFLHDLPHSLHEGDAETGDDWRTVRSYVDAILYPFWDAKWEAGGATRTVDECRQIFRGGDVRAQTAMLDARLLAGDKDISAGFFRMLNEVSGDKRWAATFSGAKYKEQFQRFKKFGRTVYLLEPHVKEGEGGLREYQTALWVGRVRKIDHRLNDPSVIESVDFLQRLRAHLHFLTGKKEDRLTFENQKQLAVRLGMDVSEMMGLYYRATTNVHRASKAVTDRAAPLLRRLFLGFTAGRIKRMIGGSPQWHRLAANRDILYPALKSLHESGDLKKVIPSFENIYHKTQYGAYHVYTVDVHSIFSVKEILKLERKDAPRVARAAFKRVKKKDLLLFAALLHDIGKGDTRGVGHTSSGVEIAGREAIAAGYKTDDVNVITFLIGSHLIMPRLAFSRDLADPRLIEDFAGSVGSIELLDMLFVLTYADIRAIGPEVWTDWKEKLLGELYLSARRFLQGAGMDHIRGRISRLKREVLEVGGEDACRWISSMPERYFIANDRRAMMSHIEMFNALKVTEEATAAPVPLVRHSSAGSYSEISIIARDAPGIFSKMTGALAASNVNILDAELNTGKDGIVIDVLRVQSEIGSALTPQMAERVARDIRDSVSGRRSVEDLLKASGRYFTKRGAEVEPMVIIDNDVSAYYTVIDIFAKDRIGLLYDLSRLLFENGCSIHIAKILTKAEMAIDSFYVKNAGGEKIRSKEGLDVLKRALLGML